MAYFILQVFHRRAVLIPENQKRCDKAVNSPQASKERTFHILMLMERLCIVAHKYMVGNCFSLTKFQARFRLKKCIGKLLHPDAFSTFLSNNETNRFV